MRNIALNIIVCGHIDHGKSTLIGRLLFETNYISKRKIEEINRICNPEDKGIEFSYLTDQLKEERENNITIDSTQAYMKIRRRNFVIIDAPGHLEFIKNMITGATQADAAILMIDAVEGLKDQTKQHVFVLNMLGIKNIIVAVNKMDLVDYKRKRFVEIKNRSMELLSVFSIEPLSIIPISAKYGDNVCERSKQMSWYKGAPVSEKILSFQNYKDFTDLPLRLPIQDVYTIDNEKVAVGRIVSGTIRPNCNIIVMSSKIKTKIKKIKVFNERKEYAKAGENIGIIVDDNCLLKRGCIIVNENNPNAINSFEAMILWLSNNSFNKDEEFNLRCSTQKTRCFIEEVINKIDVSSIKLKESNNIKNNDAAIVKIRTENKIYAERFEYISSLGRFVLESDDEIKAIGIIRKIL